MIIAKLISGLGNQLFQYAVSRQLSLARHVHLKLDTSFFSSQNLRSFKLHHYSIAAEVATEDAVNSILDVYSSRSLYAKLYRRAEPYLPKQYHHRFYEKEWWTFEPELFSVTSNVYLDGYWQHYKYLENLNPVILDELRLKEFPAKDASEYLNEIQGQPESVAVHIRRGDYVTDKDALNFMGVLPVSYYNRSIEYINNRVSNPSFYFFSDDLDWVKDTIKVNAQVHYVDIANGAKDYVELDLMSKCSHNIIANSSFSWWGAFLNRNPEKIVVAPKKWVVPEEVNKRIELILPSWVKM